ncbi:MAG: hypothetical protein JNK48_07405 [Bryobacterales bacterium]|nr:hypothetical protein [Bryobacterales bacterium]
MMRWIFVLAVAPVLMAEKPEKDNPGEAVRYFLDRRVPVGARQLPQERYLHAREKMRRMPVYSSKAGRRVAVEFDAKGRERFVSLGQWTPLGPGNVGGRTRVLLIHPERPEILYAAGVAGGVWKSVNAGERWEPLNDFLPNLAVSAMAMDPSAPETIYAGTGEGFSNFDAVRGAGIFKTVDGGANWEHLEGTKNSDFYFVMKIVVSKADPQRVYAATRTGIFRSRDAGANWERVLDRRAPLTGCQDMAIRTDVDDDYLFAACQGDPQGFVFRNRKAQSDGEWERVFTAPGMARTSLAIAPSRQSVVYAMAASNEPGTCPANPGPNPAGPCYRDGLLGVYRSTENGDPQTWETRTNTTEGSKIGASLLSNPILFFDDVCTPNGRKGFSSQGWYDNVIAVDPLDPERVWAGGIDLFRSDDGGANWGIASYWWLRGVPQYAHADQHAIVFHPRYDGEGNQVMYATNDGGVYRTNNARGETATQERAACNPANGKVTWVDLNRNYAVTQFHHGSVYPGGHFYFGGTQDNGTNRGTDAGGPERWASIQGGDGGFTAINPKDTRTMYAETTRLSLRRSTNSGATFVSAVNGITEPSANFLFIAPFAMDPSEPERLWIGGQSLWRTSNGGRNWDRASTAIGTRCVGRTDCPVTAIAVAPGDANRVLVGLRDGRIFRHAAALETNGETEWASAQPRLGVVTWIAVDPANADVAYAVYGSFNGPASDRHVYKTVDGGATWTGLDGSGDTALPDIPVHMLLIDPRKTDTLYLGTDLGVFVSLDRGASWAKEDSGFPNTVVESMTLEVQGEGALLTAFTRGRGAWKVFLGPGEACSYTLGAPSVKAGLSAGTYNVELQTAAHCAWSVLPGATWAVVDGPANGVGPAMIKVQVSGLGAGRRETALLVADKVVTVTQEN